MYGPAGISADVFTSAFAHCKASAAIFIVPNIPPSGPFVATGPIAVPVVVSLYLVLVISNNPKEKFAPVGHELAYVTPTYAIDNAAG